MKNVSGHCVLYHPSNDNPVYYTLLILISSIVTMVNFLVILTFIRYRKLRRNNNNLLVLSLSIADFLAGLSGLVCSAILRITQQRTMDYGESYGVFHSILPLSVAVNASALTLVCMTGDRLLNITCPLRYVPAVTKQKLIVVFAIIWLLPLTTCGICVAFARTIHSLIRLIYSCSVFFNWFSTVVLSVSNAMLFHISRKSCAAIKPRITDSLRTASHTFGDFSFLGYRDSRRERSRTNSRTNMIPEIACHIDTNGDFETRSRAVTTTTLDLLSAVEERPRIFRSRSSDMPSLRSFRSSERIECAKHQLRKMKHDLRTSFMCLVHTLSYIICAFPSGVFMFGILMKAWCSSTYVFKVLTHLMLINSLINPFLYFLKRKDFRKCFKKLLTRDKKKARIGVSNVIS